MICMYDTQHGNAMAIADGICNYLVIIIGDDIKAQQSNDRCHVYASSGRASSRCYFANSNIVRAKFYALTLLDCGRSFAMAQRAYKRG